MVPKTKSSMRGILLMMFFDSRRRVVEGSGMSGGALISLVNLKGSFFPGFYLIVLLQSAAGEGPRGGYKPLMNDGIL